MSRKKRLYKRLVITKKIIKGREIKVSKRRLKSLLNKKLTKKAIAKRVRISLSTLYRRLHEFKLIKRRFSPWISTKGYIEKIINKYNIHQPTPLPLPFIHKNKLILSTSKSKPKGKFDIVDIYYVAKVSAVITIRSNDLGLGEEKSLDKAFQFLQEHLEDIVSQLSRIPGVEIRKAVAFHFRNSKNKLKVIKDG